MRNAFDESIDNGYVQLRRNLMAHLEDESGSEAVTRPVQEAQSNQRENRGSRCRPSRFWPPL
jgi:hypothetical protein